MCDYDYHITIANDDIYGLFSANRFEYYSRAALYSTVANMREKRKKELKFFLGFKIKYKNEAKP